jgi:hypothetical protein
MPTCTFDRYRINTYYDLLTEKHEGRTRWGGADNSRDRTRHPGEVREYDNPGGPVDGGSAQQTRGESAGPTARGAYSPSVIITFSSHDPK